MKTSTLSIIVLLMGLVGCVPVTSRELDDLVVALNNINRNTKDPALSATRLQIIHTIERLSINVKEVERKSREVDDLTAKLNDVNIQLADAETRKNDLLDVMNASAARDRIIEVKDLMDRAAALKNAVRDAENKLAKVNIDKQKELSTLERELREQDGRLMEINDRIKTAENNRMGLLRQLDEINHKAIDFEEKVKKMGKYEIQYNNHENLKNEIIALNSEKNGFKKQIEDLQRQQKELETENEQLSQELKNLKIDSEKYNKEKKKFDEFTESINELEDVKRFYEEVREVEKRIEETERLLNEKKELLKEVEERTIKYSNELEANKKALEEVNKEYEGLTEVIPKTQIDLSRNIKKFLDTQTEVLEKKENLEKLQETQSLFKNTVGIFLAGMSTVHAAIAGYRALF